VLVEQERRLCALERAIESDLSTSEHVESE
jgi:hypothetical protein